MTEEYEELAVVRVRRRKSNGEYSCSVDFEVHSESRQGFATIDGTLTVAADLIREELHTRPTMPALAPIEVL